MYNVVAVNNLSSPYRRFVAYSIDYIVMIFLTTIVTTFSNGVIALNFILLVFIHAVYFSYLTASNWQATLGQRLMKIYVITLDGKRLSLTRSFDRYIIQWIIPDIMLIILHLMQNEVSIFGLFLVVFLYLVWISGYFMMFFNTKRQALHDYLFKTLVVNGYL
ncbi:MAG: RDD family protein [Candidatus Xenolissoclinum pacificiensis L6]|uniref:RDD family protein n=1 Tax=Candidatus Xenolissoclinum pacificiensis L6 TaxID=1401685 RepID=W2UZG6_9RICK|nr:MAG: RDD family protein [Candidatus Xenolissoclinum pacificiensis L6]